MYSAYNIVLLNINKSKTPETKMRKLREMAEIYRVILHKFDQQKQFSLEWMIYKTVVRTQPINLVTNLTYSAHDSALSNSFSVSRS